MANKLENVIKGLGCCAFSKQGNKCEQCPYFSGCETEYGAFVELAHDALALLKAQEPRVMTLEEVQISANPVWLEGGMAGGTWAMMPFMREHSIEFVADGVCTIYPAFAINEYGKTWRCWTSRPDEKRRAETPWK